MPQSLETVLNHQSNITITLLWFIWLATLYLTFYVCKQWFLCEHILCLIFGAAKVMSTIKLRAFILFEECRNCFWSAWSSNFILIWQFSTFHKCPYIKQNIFSIWLQNFTFDLSIVRLCTTHLQKSLNF